MQQNGTCGMICRDLPEFNWAVSASAESKARNDSPLRYAAKLWRYVMDVFHITSSLQFCPYKSFHYILHPLRCAVQKVSWKRFRNGSTAALNLGMPLWSPWIILCRSLAAALWGDSSFLPRHWCRSCKGNGRNIVRSWKCESKISGCMFLWICPRYPVSMPETGRFCFRFFGVVVWTNALQGFGSAPRTSSRCQWGQHTHHKYWISTWQFQLIYIYRYI